MLAPLRRFLSDVTRSRDPLPTGEDEIRLAAAALLFHVIAVDGVASDKERETLTQVLARRFDLDDTGARALVKDAEEADNEAVDLYGFTAVLKSRLDAEARERVIEMMWRLAYADGVVHEFEDNAVWRVAELLAVPTQVRIRLKQAVRGGMA